jgi:ABC-type polysaccharide/polyol phosphate export permease
MLKITPTQFAKAIADIYEGCRAWRLGLLLAWQDVKQRYRRSTLGPVWLTISMSIQIFVMGVLSAYLFNSPVEKHLPFVCAGMVFWTFIMQTISEGANLFISSSSFLIQIRRPFTMYLIQVVFRNIIGLGHNIITYVVVAAILVVVPGPGIILLPLGFALNLLCVGWMALFAGTLSVRYRDIPMTIQNVFAILFWLTPLMYQPAQLGSKAFLAEYNPLTHMIAVLREPLLGGAPTLTNWLVVIAIAVFGWIGTFLFFSRFRSRIVYWI